MEKIAKKREYRKNHIRHEKSALHHAERLSIPSVPESDCTGNLAGTEVASCRWQVGAAQARLLPNFTIRHGTNSCVRNGAVFRGAKDLFFGT